MRTAIVGDTGFVGGNLAQSHAFEGRYNSKNIEQAFGTRPELLVYAGLPAAKYLANTDPAGDESVCKNAMENIRKIDPQRLVLISTVDVYEVPDGVTEDDPASLQNPGAYGRNRAKLEQLVRAAYPDALIVRLPGLFGNGMKKNFLFDFLTVTPAMLKADRYAQLAAHSALVKTAYAPAKNGFYVLTDAAKTTDKAALRTFFAASNFNALSFTDSRAMYQFYDLTNLWRDIAWALAANLKLLNLATQPISAGEIYAALTHGGTFQNELPSPPANYDMRTRYDALYHGENGYLYSKEDVLEAICAFVAAARKKEG
ncbi:MAG: sugar nucleotide-binding protein [Ruthenibacterium sp.]